MIYQSLYRKYRPIKFSEVYGQKIAKKILMNSLKNKKISHAYLFFGPRGTGKTSIAKMFARICNCENIQDGECCEKCPSCLASKDKNCVDIVEIDAASNNGVDEIRELKSKINLIPNTLNYKVYIIDEVHMLSIGAFNALLKTLEEPPEHVVFILATTEYYKVPSTIVSRCQTIEFSNIDNLSMKNRLLEICNKEKITIEEEAVDEIINASNGGLRDAIGLLDKAIAYIENNETITQKIIREIFGNISIGEISKFAQLIEQGDTQTILSLIENYCLQGIDLIKILDDLIICFRNRMLKNKNYDLMGTIDLLNKYQIKMKNSNHKDILFEMLIIELTTKTNVREEKVENLIQKEQKVLTEKIEQNEKKEIERQENPELISIRINNSFVNADKKILNEAKELWKKLEKFTFDSEVGSVICDLIDCSPIVSSNKNLLLCSNYLSIVNKINQNIEKYEDVIREKLNLNQKIIAIQVSEWGNLKQEYLDNIKNGKKYEYINEEKKEICLSNNEKNDNISTREKAMQLFGKID